MIHVKYDKNITISVDLPMHWCLIMGDIYKLKSQHFQWYFKQKLYAAIIIRLPSSINVSTWFMVFTIIHWIDCISIFLANKTIYNHVMHVANNEHIAIITNVIGEIISIFMNVLSCTVLQISNATSTNTIHYTALHNIGPTLKCWASIESVLFQCVVLVWV